MADAHESLGKASLDLTANLSDFRREMREGRSSAEGMSHSLETVAEISRIAEEALKRVKTGPGQAAESRATMEEILRGVDGISDKSREAAHELDRVRITEAQATESDIAAKRIADGIDNIGDQARQTDRALGRLRRGLFETRVAGGVPGRSGVGVGPFGSGFGRVGVLGAAIGLGALTAPAAGPGAAGLLAAVPTLAFGAAGALGTLVLAFEGVGKAIGGDKKAFDELQPAQQKFVLTVRSMHDWLERLRQTAGKAIFPGLTAGLHSALSPGTTGIVQRSVGQFGSAIGGSAAEWGKFLGSPEFQRMLGPLMTAGAQNLRILSRTFLQLFNALGVLGRAAIPFTNWLLRSIELGARLANNWLHAKDASGSLAHGMNEARTSLTLVWKLFIALIGTVGALGRALYPVAKVAVKQLTDGLHWLTGVINRNRAVIREIVGGALAAFVSALRIAAHVGAVLFRVLNGIVHAMGGWKGAFQIVIAGFLASKFIGLAGSVGKFVEGLKEARLGALALGGPEVLAALAAFWAFKHFGGPDITPDVPTAPTVVSKFSLVAPRGTSLATDIADIKAGKKLSKGQKLDVINAFKRGDLTGGTVPSKKDIATLVDDIEHPGKGLPPKRKPAKKLAMGSHAWWIKNYGYDPGDASKGNVFGDNPPFTTNLGTAPAAVPGSVSHLLGLASEDASKAGLLKNTGPTAKRLLDAELGQLSKADQLLKAKYASSTGKTRTALFAEIVRVENKMRTVGKQIAGAIKRAKNDDLQLALDTAKLAVQNATEGSAAYDKAVTAEAKALRAEIGYWDKRAHNMKLAADKRDQALRKEISFKKELKSLLKSGAAASAGADQAQFLSSFADIMSAFAPNAFPAPAHGGKTDTHLYDLVQESRETNDHLREIRTGQRFPASRYATVSAAAVAG